jgi:DNA-binding CsgD family transcriptional regulator/pimeloyl-ACP methyl ester carboxylesterase
MNDCPPIQYARTEDGVNIAYWILGAGPTAILVFPAAVSHLTLEWQVPRFRRMQEQYASELRLIRYNPRQCGLSGVAEDLGLDAFVRDIHAVLAATGGGPAALIATTQMTPLAIGFAAAHPDAVSALVLLGPEIDFERRRIVRSALKRGTPQRLEKSLIAILNPEGLGEDAEPLRKLADHNLRSWQRLGVRDLMLEAEENWQVTELLPQLACPTLLVHYPGHAYSDGPNVAARIANARLVVREGSNAPVFNPDLEGLTTLVNHFIREHAGAPTSTQAVAPEKQSVGAIRLSPRELEVLRHVALGRTNAAIAEALGIGRSTVDRHVHHILQKSGSQNRAEAVAWGFANRILHD